MYAKKRDLINDHDLSREDMLKIFEITKKVKSEVKANTFKQYLPNNVLGMIFEKSSTRTRVSFEVGMYQLGGTGLFLSSRDIQIGRGETIHDTAKVLSRYTNILMARVYEHSKVEDLAKYADVPVINGLSDLLHPCQALTDYYTALEHGKKLEGLKFTYVGDGNNMANSIALSGAVLGCNVVISCPESLMPDKNVIDQAKSLAKKAGGSVEIINDPKEACKNADVIYTDVWASMGQEEQFKEKSKILHPYQVNKQLLSYAKQDVLFMHCLPAHREEEVTAEVIDGANSVVFDEAENRLHVQKGIILFLMGKN